MKRDWNKALDKLKKIPGDTRLSAIQWPKYDSPHNQILYSAAIVFSIPGDPTKDPDLECILSDSFDSPIKAVDDLEIKIAKYKEGGLR